MGGVPVPGSCLTRREFILPTQELNKFILYNDNRKRLEGNSFINKRKSLLLSRPYTTKSRTTNSYTARFILFLRRIGFTRHFTVLNLILGLLVLIILGLIKHFSIVSFLMAYFGFSESEFNENLVTVALALAVRLGIKGIVEEFISPYIEEMLTSWMKISDLLNPEEDSSSGNGSRPGGSRGNHPVPVNSPGIRAGNSQGNLTESSPGNSSGNSQGNNLGNYEQTLRERGYYWSGQGSIDIHDPTGVRPRGLCDKNGNLYPSSQPYATNLANALEAFAPNRSTSITSLPQFTNEDQLFLRKMNEYNTYTTNLNRITNKALRSLRNLP